MEIKRSILLCFLLAIFLQGCAVPDAPRPLPSPIYGGNNQTAKGVMLGGATGAVVGAVASGGSGILPGAAGGAIFGGALGAYLDANTTIADEIINRGNKIIVLGDQILIVLPSRITFLFGTPKIQMHAYGTLDLVAQLISGYANMSVKVTAYTSSVLPPGISRSLSQQQANAIVKYLWRANINTRVLYGEGASDSKPITKIDSDANNRVEITLEKLPV